MALVTKIRNQHIRNITRGSQRSGKCGSGQNGILELEDGTTACLRYMKYKTEFYCILGKL